MSCTKTCVEPTPAQAHCGACHVTLGGVTGFDRHRRGGVCIHPREIGMIERRGVWRLPGPDLTDGAWPPARQDPPQTAETPKAGVIR